MAKQPPLGSGARFSKLAGSLAKRPGVKNPAALAAAIGRKKYGPKKFAKLGAKKAAPNRPNPPTIPNAPVAPPRPRPALGVGSFEPTVKPPGLGGRY